MYLQHCYVTRFDVINNPIFAFTFNFDEGLEKICTKEALVVAKKQCLKLTLKTDAQVLIFLAKTIALQDTHFLQVQVVYFDLKLS